jgi:L-alanine-DL-glutamate epimerase-like enolase superfamily enzyme
MQITRVTTRVLDTLDDSPLVPGLPEPGEHTGPRQLLTLELGTDAGLVGLGVTFWHGALAPALTAALDALARLTLGEDPTRVEVVARKLRGATGRTSARGSGIFNLALAAVDMACWDIKGKAAGQSVCALLGGARDRIPTYASGALLRGYSLDCLERTSRSLIEMGFRQMKMQCGSEATAGGSVERVRVVREAVGPDVDVMCDVNQLWSVHQAVEMGRLLEPYRLYWLEDPTVPEDHPGLARIAEALTTPIVAGEYCYDISAFRHLLEARSTDIVMIDLLRVGGITQWLKVAALAEAFNQTVVSHLLPEIHVQLVAAVPNGLTVEYRPLTSGVFEAVPELSDGQLVVPERPGLGLTLDPRAVQRYEIAHTTHS